MSNRSNIGFAGLQTLVSDVAPAIQEAERRMAERASTSSRESGAAPTSEASRREGARSCVSIHSRPAPETTFRWGKLVVGVLIVGAIVLFNIDSDGARASAASVPTNGFQPLGGTNSGVAGIAPPSDVLYEKRPMAGGSDRVLGVAEVRYCLAEDIRINASDPVVDLYSTAAVSRFNGYVDDFNARCGEYRYRSGTLERARVDVERHRHTLASEGRARF